MTLPVLAMVRPADLAGQANGQLAAHLLAPIDGGEVLHHLAARSWAAMRAAARADGIDLRVGADAYRPYTEQRRIFIQRYTPHPSPVPGSRGPWEGRWWTKKPGQDAAAVPGTSNHGWGLAIDVAGCTTNGKSDPNTPVCRWLRANAHRFGWSAEIQSEAWHWRAVHGDRLPPAVVAYGASLAPAPPVPVPPPVEYPMPELLIQCPPAGGAVLARYTNGHLSHLGWEEYQWAKGKGVREVTENDPAAAGRYVAEAAGARA